MAADLNRRTWQPSDVNTPQEQRDASLYVASIATSKADATHLLDILGLLPTRLRITEHGMPGYRAGCRCKTCRSANARRTRDQRRDAKTGATK